MTVRFKITVLILAISAILPFVAFNLKAPHFLNPLERSIANFQEPQQIKIVERKIYYTRALEDPFKISERVKISLKNDLNIASLSMIYKGKKRYVIFGDSIVKEGDRIGDFSIVRILDDRVLIKDKKGEKIWVRLENY